MTGALFKDGSLYICVTPSVIDEADIRRTLTSSIHNLCRDPSSDRINHSLQLNCVLTDTPSWTVSHQHCNSAIKRPAVCLSVCHCASDSLHDFGAIYIFVYECMLLRPRERLRSIVMSASVCLSLRQYISGTTRAIFTCFCA